MEEVEDVKRMSRRKHSAELKARVLSECAQPGASVAGIAQRNGLNANLVHRWLRLARPSRTPAASMPRADRAADGAGAFIALTVPQPAPASQPDIRIELRRGATVVNVHWPVHGGSDCAAWLREWLR